MEKIKTAKQRGEDLTDEEVLKKFKASIPIIQEEDIESPPDSDDEEGQTRSARRRIDALERGRERYRKIYTFIRNEMREGRVNVDPFDKENERPAEILWTTVHDKTDLPSPVASGSMAASTPSVSCRKQGNELTTSTLSPITSNVGSTGSKFTFKKAKQTAAEPSTAKSHSKNQMKSPPLIREWLTESSYADWPWEQVPTLPFSQVIIDVMF